MYALIREKDGNLFAHDLYVRVFDDREQATTMMLSQYALEYIQPEIIDMDSDVHVKSDIPCAYVMRKDGSRTEWRVIEVEKGEKRPITVADIGNAFASGVISIVDSPDGGTMCRFGDNWLWFGGMEAEDTSAAIYMQEHELMDVFEDIADVLDGLYSDDIDEWLYYRSLIDEMYERA